MTKQQFIQWVDKKVYKVFDYKQERDEVRRLMLICFNKGAECKSMRNNTASDK